jgi:hypothetical protein
MCSHVQRVQYQGEALTTEGGSGAGTPKDSPPASAGAGAASISARSSRSTGSDQLQQPGRTSRGSAVARAGPFEFVLRCEPSQAAAAPPESLAGLVGLPSVASAGGASISAAPWVVRVFRFRTDQLSTQRSWVWAIHVSSVNAILRI